MTDGVVSVSRSLDSDFHYDVIIIGGGIYGAAHAWEAASRGLSVVLFDESDFGGSTSANSLKTIHGGIRYLQKVDIIRTLESKRERDTLLRIAPHLVQPLACVMPAYAWTSKGKVATAVGAGLYNFLSACDEMSSTGSSPTSLRAEVLNQAQVRTCIPESHAKGVSGGIRWYDGQAYDSERLVLAFVLSARERGAQVYNYLRVKDLSFSEGRLQGVLIQDRRNEEEREIRGHYVIDATGGRFDRARNAGTAKTHFPAFAKAVNLVYPARHLHNAIGLKTDARSEDGQSGRLLFSVPWRDRTIIGTWYFPVSETVHQSGLTSGEFEICNTDVQRLSVLADGNAAEPCLIHIGLVPVTDEFTTGDYPRLLEDTLVIDHKRQRGGQNIFSIYGVKYTTARATAQRTIDKVAARLGKQSTSMTTRQPLLGGDIEDFDAFCQEKARQYESRLGNRTIRTLLRKYGSKIDSLFEYIRQDEKLIQIIPEAPECIKAQIVYAVREEMAQRLTDVMVRRIGLGGLGRPAQAAIDCCLDVMASLLAWTDTEKQKQMQELEDYYGKHSR